MKNEKLKTEAAPFGIILNAPGGKKIPYRNCCSICFFLVIFSPKASINQSAGHQFHLSFIVNHL
jgi:hypothetical protein